MSKNEGITHSYEAMRAELEAAGYDFKDEYKGFVKTPDGHWLYHNRKHRVALAYAHYQQQQRLAEALRLLKIMVGYATYEDIFLSGEDCCSGCHAYLSREEPHSDDCPVLLAERLLQDATST